MQKVQNVAPVAQSNVYFLNYTTFHTTIAICNAEPFIRIYLTVSIEIIEYFIELTSHFL